MTVRRSAYIQANSEISRNGEVKFSQLHDDLLAMDERAGYCYALNVSAARVWGLIGTPARVESICAILCREFNVDPESCLHDITELLQAMCEAGLVSVTDGKMDQPHP